MRKRKTLPSLVLASLVCGAWAILAADPLPSTSPIVIVDGAGKEQKVKGWTFSQGTRRLSWMAPAMKEEPPKNDKDGDSTKPKQPAKAPVKVRPAIGPEALEFREDNSTNFVDGILTLIPLDRIRTIEYDDKDGVAVNVFLGPKADGDLMLKGTTKFKGINKIAIEAEVDKGELGVAQLKFLGGIPKGIKSVRFESPKQADHPKGRPAFVTVADKGPKTQTQVVDLQPLYQGADGREQLLPTLMFKKTLKVDVGKVQKIVVHEGRDPDVIEWTVTLKDGSELTLTLLKSITHEEKTLTLQGLLGQVTAGFRLFPLHTFSEIEFDAPKGEKPPPP